MSKFNLREMLSVTADALLEKGEDGKDQLALSSAIVTIAGKSDTGATVVQISKGGADAEGNLEIDTVSSWNDSDFYKTVADAAEAELNKQIAELTSEANKA
ncbi:MAG: hypothetical protein [Bacteriophage sp.]|nr:MAG: hypothetical protein [Bacteriophage sp.]